MSQPQSQKFLFVFDKLRKAQARSSELYSFLGVCLQDYTVWFSLLLLNSSSNQEVHLRVIKSHLIRPITWCMARHSAGRDGTGRWIIYDIWLYSFIIIGYFALSRNKFNFSFSFRLILILIEIFGNGTEFIFLDIFIPHTYMGQD